MTKTNEKIRKGFTRLSGLAAICMLMLGPLVFPFTAHADSSRLFSSPGFTSADINKIVVAVTDKTTSKKAKKKRKKAKKKSQRKKKKVKRRTRDFDHLLTGFSLFGSHVNVECEACHLHEIFRGTPKTCEGCHGLAGQRSSTTKPINHVITNQPCDICHNINIWAGARFDHSAVAPDTCTRCHNGSTADAKPASGHPTTTESCESCHSMGGGWHPARFRHTNVAPGTCSTCHGVTATGKPGGHVATNDSCDVCHRTSAWLPANSHSTGVAPGSCKNCHNYGGGHFFIKTQPSCDDCHNDDRWTPLRVYNHLAVSNHSPGVNCDACHTTNTDDATWTTPSYRPFCAGCHFDDWKPGPHKKYLDVKYTLDELKDCTTSCHEYEDATLSLPYKKERPGKHRPSDSDF